MHSASAADTGLCGAPNGDRMSRRSQLLIRETLRSTCVAKRCVRDRLWVHTVVQRPCGASFPASVSNRAT